MLIFCSVFTFGVYFVAYQEAFPENQPNVILWIWSLAYGIMILTGDQAFIQSSVNTTRYWKTPDKLTLFCFWSYHNRINRLTEAPQAFFEVPTEWLTHSESANFLRIIILFELINRKWINYSDFCTLFIDQKLVHTMKICLVGPPSSMIISRIGTFYTMLLSATLVTLGYLTSYFAQEWTYRYDEK